MEMSEAQATWGARIRKIRREKELTAAAFAREVGISRGYLHELERGNYAPSDEVKVRIAKALDVEPNELFDLRVA